MSTAIWWIRRDLRLNDNQSLAAANRKAVQLIPLFILDEALLNSEFVGDKRTAFLFDGLRRLDIKLREKGSYLVLRQGKPLEVLSQLVQQHRVDRIFAEMDFSPYAKQRDIELSSRLPVEWVVGSLIHPPGKILNKEGKPFTVFTPFLAAWKAAPASNVDKFMEVERIVTPAGIPTLPIPHASTEPGAIPFTAGESEACARLERFLSEPAAETKMKRISPMDDLPPVYRYAAGRNQYGANGTSMLSPYLRFGMISIRQVVNAAYDAVLTAPDATARLGAETWLNQLVWREFYYHILDHFPQVREGNFRPKEIRWLNEEHHFSAWCNGETGFPIVDAAMRQLRMTGWMHNRLRMVVASFLTKDLLVDWRWGEKYFMQQLVDGDPASNNGGWQWTAGTGSDAAPYFRVFNPVLQSRKFNPEGNYIREWIPELANLPDEFIHEPGLMPYDVQLKTGCIVGKDYPFPIVDHKMARLRALQAYGQESSPVRQEND